MFECDSDLFDRVLNRFIGPLKCGAVPERTVRGDSCGLDVIALVSPSRATRHGLTREGYTHSRSWAVLPSRGVPRWLLPLGNCSGTISGTQIYEPQACTTRIMKNLLLRSIRIGWNGWARDKVFIASKEPLALEVLVKEITGEADPIFALSVGNQRAMRKLTVQAMRPDGGILGYMKLPLTEAATERVRHEAQTLERLWALPYLRPHIPRVLYSGMCNGTYVLFQTSVVGKRGPASMGEIHENFLQNLGNVHRLEKPGERLIEEVAAHWAKSSSQAETAWQELGREVLRRCMQDLSGVMVPCGVMHGDFAPWNTRVHLGRLFIFDWESAVWEAPLSWDMFHFEVQTTCFLNRGKRNTFISQSTPAHQASYLLYVLRSAAQLIAEEADRTGINYRRALLAKLLSEQAVAKNVSSGVRRPFDSIRAVQD